MIFFLKMVIKPVSTATVTEGIEQQFTVERHLIFFHSKLEVRVIKAASHGYIHRAVCYFNSLPY